MWSTQQIPGAQLVKNLTELLPIKVRGGTLDDLSPNRIKALRPQREPEPKNGLARDLFAGDLEAVRHGRLALPHEEREKELLKIGVVVVCVDVGSLSLTPVFKLFTKMIKIRVLEL